MPLNDRDGRRACLFCFLEGEHDSLFCGSDSRRNRQGGVNTLLQVSSHESLSPVSVVRASINSRVRSATL